MVCSGRLTRSIRPSYPRGELLAALCVGADEEAEFSRFLVVDGSGNVLMPETKQRICDSLRVD